MTDTVVVPARFNGPPGSGNGGWTSGHLAQLVEGGAEGGPVTVRLRTPPPLEVELAVAYADDGTVELYDGPTLVAQAFPAEPLDPAGLPAPVPVADATAAGAAYQGLVRHPFPTCFSCGTQRDPADALCLRTGPLPGREPLHAAAWTPREVTPEVVWAALDCPGAWASGLAGRDLVLGTMTAQLWRLPRPGRPHVVLAWPRGREGRKHYSGTALYDEECVLLGRADAIWVALPPA